MSSFASSKILSLQARCRGRACLVVSPRETTGTAYGNSQPVDPLKIRADQVDGFSSSLAGPTDWDHLYAVLVGDQGISPRDYGDLTITQFRVPLAKGQPDDPASGPDLSFDETIALAIRRAGFWDELAESPG